MFKRLPPENNRRWAEEQVRSMRIADRVAAFRHALLWAGYEPQSIDMAVERNREWLESGDPLERKMR
jgi:hypothetical protein